VDVRRRDCATGNAFILKPSERDPSVPVRLAELFLEAGACPKACFQVVHGDKEMVDAILDHPDIGAVSFVGSSDIAHYVYNRGIANGKRVQAMGGAKNHGIVMPDADLDQVVNDLTGAAFGSAGERCMALPVVVPVGEDTAERLKRKADPRDRGAARRRVDRCRGALWARGDAGAQGQGRAAGSRNAPTKAPSWSSTAAASRCRATRRASLSARRCSIMSPRHGKLQGRNLRPRAADRPRPRFETALELPSKHQYGNGVAIFTRNGHAAREFAARVNVGMVGINVPIPVPVAYHTFGGWKRSAFGDTNQHGMEGVKFWTKVKTDHRSAGPTARPTAATPS
jgi:malonate-semialdehyde dehydrogenase (acetylating)/methylmalonate-semialdehyde dehydrogenase